MWRGREREGEREAEREGEGKREKGRADGRGVGELVVFVCVCVRARLTLSWAARAFPCQQTLCWCVLARARVSSAQARCCALLLVRVSMTLLVYVEWSRTQRDTSPRRCRVWGLGAGGVGFIKF